MFLQRLDSSPLDPCCFSLHLCRLSPILNLLFRSISLSRLIVSPLLTLLSFLDFSFVIHLTWSSHVTCDTCAESHSNDLTPLNNYVLCTTSLTPERKVARRVPTIPTKCFFFKTTALLIGLGCSASLGNAGGGGGKVASLTTVDERLGALVRVMNTDGFASNACTNCGTSYRRPSHPSILRLVVVLPFHPQLVDALMTSYITNATDFIMSHSIVTPKRL